MDLVNADLWEFVTSAVHEELLKPPAFMQRLGLSGIDYCATTIS